VERFQPVRRFSSAPPARPNFSRTIRPASPPPWISTIPVIPLDLPSYQKKENWGASETFYRLVRGFASQTGAPRRGVSRLSCNILGPTALGFRNRDDDRGRNLHARWNSWGSTVNVVAPLGASPADLARIPEADVQCGALSGDGAGYGRLR
jgi:hypothetical protein